MKILTAFILFYSAIFASPAFAQGMSIIRDTEIENTLKEWVAPVLQAAGMGRNQVDIVLVDSDEINAFVAGGANLFIYAGLIQKADYPEEIIGVMAHEIGHIQGGHLIETRRAAERATYQSILATVAGLGAAIATGEGGAATAISMGGSGAAQGRFFAHSRTQESAADQAALRYLRGAEINPQGLVTFLEKLEGQELLPASQQSGYMRTHPLTRDRISAMKEGARQSPYTSATGKSEKQHEFDLIRAKLRAFREPHMVARYYNPDSDDEIDAYANAIMHYRQRDYDQALASFDTLLKKHPQNAAYTEMKAQILRDAGRLDEAENYYKKTLSLINGDAPLSKTSLAHVMIEQQKYTAEVEQLLNEALQEDNREIRAYRLLATLKGRQGYESDAQYFLAEEAAASGRRSEAKQLLAIAMKSGDLSGDIRYKAQDLKIYLDTLPGKAD